MPFPPFSTLRLVSHNPQQVDGEWFYDPLQSLASARKTLKDYQREEPQRGWHLETRGTHRDWHDMD